LFVWLMSKFFADDIFIFLQLVTNHGHHRQLRFRRHHRKQN
jgi:hypothetical protein